MSDLSRTKAVILVFAMPGCHACHDYLPRLQKQITAFKRSGCPIHYHELGCTVPRNAIVVAIFDSTSQDPELQALLDQYKIQGMPTTLLLTHNAAPVQLEGAIDDQQIYTMLASAAYANR